MKRVVKFLVGLALGVVVLASVSVEAKADAVSDYYAYVSYITGGGNAAAASAYAANYMAEYQAYINAYQKYAAEAIQMRTAAEYLAHNTPYTNPTAYYQYANYITNGDFGRENGSLDTYTRTIEHYMEQYYLYAKFSAENAQYIAALKDLQEVYKIGEYYKGFTSGTNPYAPMYNNAVNEYTKWLNGVAKYFE